MYFKYDLMQCAFKQREKEHKCVYRKNKSASLSGCDGQCMDGMCKSVRYSIHFYGRKVILSLDSQ